MSIDPEAALKQLLTLHTQYEKKLNLTPAQQKNKDMTWLFLRAKPEKNGPEQLCLEGKKGFWGKLWISICNKSGQYDFETNGKKLQKLFQIVFDHRDTLDTEKIDQLQTLQNEYNFVVGKVLHKRFDEQKAPDIDTKIKDLEIHCPWDELKRFKELSSDISAKLGAVAKEPQSLSSNFRLSALGSLQIQLGDLDSKLGTRAAPKIESAIKQQLEEIEKLTPDVKKLDVKVANLQKWREAVQSRAINELFDDEKESIQEELTALDERLQEISEFSPFLFEKSAPVLVVEQRNQALDKLAEMLGRIETKAKDFFAEYQSRFARESKELNDLSGAAAPAKNEMKPQNGAKDVSPGQGSPGRGNAALGKDELAGTAVSGEVDLPEIKRAKEAAQAVGSTQDPKKWKESYSHFKELYKAAIEAYNVWSPKRQQELKDAKTSAVALLQSIQAQATVYDEAKMPIVKIIWDNLREGIETKIRTFINELSSNHSPVETGQALKQEVETECTQVQELLGEYLQYLHALAEEQTRASNCRRSLEEINKLPHALLFDKPIKALSQALFLAESALYREETAYKTKAKTLDNARELYQADMAALQERKDALTHFARQIASLQGEVHGIAPVGELVESLQSDTERLQEGRPQLATFMEEQLRSLRKEIAQKVDSGKTSELDTSSIKANIEQFVQSSSSLDDLKELQELDSIKKLGLSTSISTRIEAIESEARRRQLSSFQSQLTKLMEKMNSLQQRLSGVPSMLAKKETDSLLALQTQIQAIQAAKEAIPDTVLAKLQDQLTIAAQNEAVIDQKSAQIESLLRQSTLLQEQVRSNQDRIQVLANCVKVMRQGEESITQLESAFARVATQLAAINKESLMSPSLEGKGIGADFEGIQQEVKEQEQLLSQARSDIHHRLLGRFEAKRNQWESLRDQAKALRIDTSATERALEKITLPVPAGKENEWLEALLSFETAFQPLADQVLTSSSELSNLQKELQSYTKQVQDELDILSKNNTPVALLQRAYLSELLERIAHARGDRRALASLATEVQGIKEKEQQIAAEAEKHFQKLERSCLELFIPLHGFENELAKALTDAQSDTFWSGELQELQMILQRLNKTLGTLEALKLSCVTGKPPINAAIEAAIEKITTQKKASLPNLEKGLQRYHDYRKLQEYSRVWNLNKQCPQAIKKAVLEQGEYLRDCLKASIKATEEKRSWILPQNLFSDDFKEAVRECRDLKSIEFLQKQLALPSPIGKEESAELLSILDQNRKSVLQRMQQSTETALQSIDARKTKAETKITELLKNRINFDSAPNKPLELIVWLNHHQNLCADENTLKEYAKNLREGKSQFPPFKPLAQTLEPAILIDRRMKDLAYMKENCENLKKADGAQQYQWLLLRLPKLYNPGFSDTEKMLFALPTDQQVAHLQLYSRYLTSYLNYRDELITIIDALQEKLEPFAVAKLLAEVEKLDATICRWLQQNAGNERTEIITTFARIHSSIPKLLQEVGYVHSEKITGALDRSARLIAKLHEKG